MKQLSPVLDGGPAHGVGGWKLEHSVEGAVDELYRSLLGTRRMPKVKIFVEPDPGIPVEDDVAAEFVELADRWEHETAALSFMTRKALHDDYQSIIGMGPKVVPLLLRRLEQRGGHWFWALHAITREDPAADADSMHEATEAWLRWGRDRGLV